MQVASAFLYAATFGAGGAAWMMLSAFWNWFDENAENARCNTVRSRPNWVNAASALFKAAAQSAPVLSG